MLYHNSVLAALASCVLLGLAGFVMSVSEWTFNGAMTAILFATIAACAAIGFARATPPENTKENDGGHD